jgi:hypothetical protein
MTSRKPCLRKRWLLGYLLLALFVVHLVLLEDGSALLGHLFPGAQSSEGTCAESINMLQPVDVAGVDPSESVTVSEMDQEPQKDQLTLL